MTPPQGLTFQAIKQPVAGGHGPYQIEASRGGVFVPGIVGLDKPTLDKQMEALAARGASIVSNEWFAQRPVAA